MVISISRAMITDAPICTSIDQVRASLPPELRPAFGRFVSALKPPPDAPGCRVAIAQAEASITSYLIGLGASANESLLDLADEVASLRAEIDNLPLPPFSRAALRRRLSRAPAWGLFLEIDGIQLPTMVAEGIGAELAWAWAGGFRFSPSLATNLRRATFIGADLTQPDQMPFKQLLSATRTANVIFHAKAPTSTSPDDPKKLALDIRGWFRNQIYYANDKTQQGVPYHRTQTIPQFVASCKEQRRRVEAGDNLAAHTCYGGLLCLGSELVARIPIFDAETPEDWLIAIDVDRGCLLFAVTLFAEGGASPSTRAAVGAIAPSSGIFVTPSPVFLADLCRKRRQENPDARNLGTLLPVSEPLAATTKTLDQAGMVAPSYARFRNTFAPFAIANGIDRYVTSIVCHDPRVVPSGKFFYSRCTREEAWEASDQLFSAMGWGPPVPLVPGLPGGSQVTPTDDTVREWFTWLSQEVDSVRPKQPYSLESLVAFYNVFMKAAASALSLVLVLRERKEIPLTGQSIAGRGATLTLGDKRVGEVPGPRAVPLPGIANSLIDAILSHIAATDACLDALGISADSAIRIRFRQILAGDPVPLLSTIRRGRHSQLGTKELEGWWPERFGMAGNGGRHFFQNALRDHKVHSTDIDIYTRHLVRGISPSSSTSLKSLLSVAERLVPAIDEIAARAGLRVLRGLAGGNGGEE